MDVHSSQAGNGFAVRPGPDFEYKNGVVSQMTPGPTMAAAIQRLSDNRNSVGNQNGRRAAVDEAGRGNPTHSHPI